MNQAQFKWRFYEATEYCVKLAQASEYSARVYGGIAADAPQKLKPIVGALKQQLSYEMLKFLKKEARRLYYILKISPMSDGGEILRNILFGKIDDVDVEEQAVEAERNDMAQVLASAFRVPRPKSIKVMGTGLYVLDYETFVLNLLHGYQPSIRSTSQFGSHVQNERFYIVTRHGDTVRYLHSDGSLQQSIVEADYVSGYFASREDAHEAIRQSF